MPIDWHWFHTILTRARSTSNASLGRWGLFAAIALAFLLQLVVACRSPVIDEDGVTFIRMAQGLEHEPLLTIREADQHPGYPFLILMSKWMLDGLGVGLTPASMDGALVAPGVEGWLLAGRIPPAVFGLLCVYLVFHIGRRTLGTRSAVVASVVLAILPLFRRGAANVLSDPVALGFLLAAATCAIEGIQRRRAGWLLASGTLSGLGYLVRPEAIEVAIVAGGWLATGCLRGPSSGRARTLMLLTALTIGSLVPALPYAVTIGGLTKKTRVSQLAPGRWGNFRPFSPADLVQTALDTSSRLVAPPEANAAPTAFAAPQHSKRPRPEWDPISLFPGVLRWLGIISRLIAHGLRYVFLLPLAVGLFAPCRSCSDSRAARFLGALAAFHLLLLLVLFFAKGYVSGRHLLPILAIALPWVGKGWILLITLVMQRLCPRFHSSHPDLIWLGLLTMVAALFLPWSTKPLHADRASLLDAIGFLCRASTPTDPVLTNTNWFLFYAGREGCVMYRGGVPIEPWCSRPADSCIWLAINGNSHDIETILATWGKGFREVARFPAPPEGSAFLSFIGYRGVPP